MDRLEESRLAWQRAQAELQKAQATLEGRVASVADPAAIQIARDDAMRAQKLADELLQRYISQLGKS